jgi:hypothetical protein
MIDRWSTFSSGACAGWSLLSIGACAGASRAGSAAPPAADEFWVESSDEPPPQPARTTPVINTAPMKSRVLRMAFLRTP